jgi:integrase
MAQAFNIVPSPAVPPFNIHPIQKKGKDYFLVKYKAVGGWKNKWAPVDKTTEGEVAAWFRDWITGEANKPAPVVPGPPAVKTIASLADWWFEYREKLRDEELINRKGYINNWILGKGNESKSGKKGDLPPGASPVAYLDLEVTHNPNNDPHITEINDAKFTVCAEWVKSIDRAPATVRNIVQTVRTLIADARAAGKISRTNSLNWFDDDIVKKAVNGGKPVVPLVQSMGGGKHNRVRITKETVWGLLRCSTVQPIRQVRYWLAIATGMRSSELCGLQWGDIDLATETPTVRVGRQLEKDSKKPRGVFGKAKFKEPKADSYRVLPLHPAAIEVLRSWKQEGWEKHVGWKPRATDPVLASNAGEFYRPKVAKDLRADLKRAKQPETYTARNGREFPIDFHGLRRTFINLLEKDAKVERAHTAALAGHGTAEDGATESNYLDGSDMSHAAKDVAKLPLPPTKR